MNAKILIRFIMAILLLGVVACSDSSDLGSPKCILADEFGGVKSKNLRLEATDASLSSDTNGWKNSGVSVKAGDKVFIKTSGSINLCNNRSKDSVTVDGYADSYYASPWGWREVSETTGSSNPLILNKHDQYEIRLTHRGATGADIDKGEWHCSGRGSGNHSECALKNGEGFMFYAPGIMSNTQKYSYFNPAATDSRRYDMISDVARSSAAAKTKLYYKFEDDWSNPSYMGDNWGGLQYQVKYWRAGCSGHNGNYLRLKDAGVDNSIISLHKYPGGFSYTATKNGEPKFQIYEDANYNWEDEKDGSGDGTGSNKGDGYNDKNSNVGGYDIVVRITDSNSTDIINSIVGPIRKILLGDKNASPPIDGLTERMYKRITNNSEYIRVAQALMATTIIFFSFSYMIGLSKITQKELFYLILKLSIVIAAISPGSWEFFYDYLFVFFIEGTDQLIYLLTSQFDSVYIPGDGSKSSVLQGEVAYLTGTDAANVSANAFSFLNVTLSKIFSEATQLKILGLFSFAPIGWVYAILMYLGIAVFLLSVAKAVLIYIMSILFTSLLLFMAPIFILFILFDATKKVFDNWVKQLISFMAQPIFLFIILSIFNIFILSAMYTVLSFSVCEGCAFGINLGLINDIFQIENNLSICFIRSYLPWGYDSGFAADIKIGKSPVSWFMIIIFVMLCYILHKMLEFIVTLSNLLISGDAGLALDAPAAAMVEEVKNTATSTAKGAKNTLKVADDFTGKHASDQSKMFVRATLGGLAEKVGFKDAGKKIRKSDAFKTSNEKKGKKSTSLKEFLFGSKSKKEKDDA
ncbi:type IV secretion system protein [Rickettsiales bacterium]|nr:type IV secretion system protein [Rickettsiales bacterium]